MTLKLPDGERRVHKAVLAARSTVFRQMFETDMAELATGRVDIPDAEASVMDAFLRFLYTDRVPEADDDSIATCSSLLPLAKKYEVPGLIAHCCSTLVAGVSVHNAASFLEMADLYDVSSLKEAALKFITRSRENLIAVQDTPAFDNLDKDLMKELFVAVTGVKRTHTDTCEFPDGSDWQKLTLAQLRRACIERKLPSTGNKKVLLARLTAE